MTPGSSWARMAWAGEGKTTVRLDATAGLRLHASQQKKAAGASLDHGRPRTETGASPAIGFTMKIFKIHQNVNKGYDTYDSAVVIAENQEAAQAMLPVDDPDEDGCRSYEWAPIEFVKVEYLGEALPDAEAGVVTASFNAG